MHSKSPADAPCPSNYYILPLWLQTACLHHSCHHTILPAGSHPIPTPCLPISSRLPETSGHYPHLPRHLHTPAPLLLVTSTHRFKWLAFVLRPCVLAFKRQSQGPDSYLLKGLPTLLISLRPANKCEALSACAFVFWSWLILEYNSKLTLRFR